MGLLKKTPILTRPHQKIRIRHFTACISFDFCDALLDFCGISLFSMCYYEKWAQ